MTTDRLPWLLCVVLAALLAWVYIGSSEHEARADVFEERADSLKVRADSLHEASVVKGQRADSTAVVNETLAARLDTLTDARKTDSTAHAAERREDSARTRQATVAASDALDSILAHVDTAGVAHVATYVSARDSLDAASEREVVRLTVELGSTKEELVGAHNRINGLIVEVGQLRAWGMGLESALEAEQGVSASIRSANESLRRGLRSANRHSTILKAGGTLLALKVAYDFVRDR